MSKGRKEDPRIKYSYKSFAIAWIFFTAYLLAIMGLSYFLGNRPYLFGLPCWVAIANIVVPFLFVILLIIIVEKLIPDISLMDNDKKEEE